MEDLEQAGVSEINCAAMNWSEQTGSVYCRERTRFVYEPDNIAGQFVRYTSYELLFTRFGLFQVPCK